MFSQLCSVLHDNCPKLILLDVGDNKLTNGAIDDLCSLIIPNENRAGLFILLNNEKEKKLYLFFFFFI